MKITNGFPLRLDWPQDVLARAAEAAREVMPSGDSILVASAVLNAALRNHTDLHELLHQEPVQRTRPQAFKRKLKGEQDGRPPGQSECPP